MIKVAALFILVASVFGDYPAPRHGYGHGYAPAKVVKVVEKVEAPAPYEFSYEVVDEEHNSNSRQESGDEYGNKKGSYTIKLANGLERIVEYVADEGGNRVIIKTNEPGTDNQNPADVEIHADPIVVKEEPKKVIKKVLVAPSYGHRAYAAPSYGHHGYAGRHHGYKAHGIPAHSATYEHGKYERDYGRSHSYEAKKGYGIKATGHASTTYNSGYGKDGYKHSVARVHSRRYDTPSYGYAPVHYGHGYRHEAPAYGYGYKPVIVKKVEKAEKVEKVEEKKEEKME